jgi:hypothetical protein
MGISIEEIAGVGTPSRASRTSKIQELMDYLNRPEANNATAKTSSTQQTLDNSASCNSSADASQADDSTSTLSAADMSDVYDAVKQQMLGSKSTTDAKSSTMDREPSSPAERIEKLLSQLEKLLTEQHPASSQTRGSSKELDTTNEAKQANPSDGMNVQRLQELLRLLAGNQKPQPSTNTPGAGSGTPGSGTPPVNASSTTGQANMNTDAVDLKNVLSSLEKLLAGITAEKPSQVQAHGADLNGANSFAPSTGGSESDGNTSSLGDANNADMLDAGSASASNDSKTNQIDSADLEKLLEFLSKILTTQKAPQQQPIPSAPNATGGNANSGGSSAANPMATNNVPTGNTNPTAEPKSSLTAKPEAQGSAKSSNLADFYKGGTPGPKDEWGDSQNVNKPAVFKAVFQSVKDNWDTGAIPQNVKDLFSSSKTDSYFDGLNLSSDAKTKAQQKAAIWELATASHETGNSYDPGKLPSYWEAGGSGTHAGQTQTAGMIADPKGMTYGMFSTESTKPIDVADPRKAVVADLQKFGQRYAEQNEDLQATLKFIGQTDSTSVIPSIKQHGVSYLESFEA